MWKKRRIFLAYAHDVVILDLSEREIEVATLKRIVTAKMFVW